MRLTGKIIVVNPAEVLSERVPGRLKIQLAW
jgi:hypothetical protein